MVYVLVIGLAAIDFVIGLVRKPSHGSCFRSISYHLVRRGESQWLCGLDGRSASRVAGMDGPVSVHQADYQHQPGS